MREPTENNPTELRLRDARVASILGLFFLVLAVPVAVGAISATLAIDRLLSLAAATILLAVGGVFLWVGSRWRTGNSSESP
jgi:membrane protein YdbS with pleckstrin-like domain